MSLLWSGTLGILGTRLRSYFLESPESSMVLRNIGFGSRERNLGSCGLLSVTSCLIFVLIPLTLIFGLCLPEFYFPHVENGDKMTLLIEYL